MCIEEFDCWDFRGYFYTPFLKEKVCFSTFSQFILQANSLMDEVGVPQRSMEKRKIATFEQTNSWTKQVVLEKSDFDNYLKFCSLIGNKDMSVSIQVLFRQNATWQGTVQLGKENVSFRSETELLDLIHQYLQIKMSLKNVRSVHKNT